MNYLIQQMTDEELDLINALINEYLGLSFNNSKKLILESRLKPRLQQLKLNRFIDYYFYLLLNKDHEYEYLSNLITNNETYFFRENHHFEILFSEALELVKNNCCIPNKLRFLSAGCSSGEEPYTLNIYAKENKYKLWGHEIEIDAFDIDIKCIEKAKKAIYQENSLRFVEEDIKSKYFNKINKDSYILKEMFKNGINFFHANLLDLSTYYKPIPYDVIFCRNVIIYFSEAAIFKTIENLKQCLRKNGLLFIGHSESLIGLTNDFESFRIGNYIIYRRI